MQDLQARRLLLPAVAGAAALMLGCASLTPPAPPATPAPPAAPPAAAPAPAAPPRPGAMAVERQWLQSWFEGTPVRIEQRSASSFSVAVPRSYCFAAGAAEVMPPLAAVLDKVAQSLKRQPEARLLLLAAPDDVPGVQGLAQQRADALLRRLRAHGVAERQLASPSAGGTAVVQLRVGFAAP